jgi:seryl-tRNA synthetase
MIYLWIKHLSRYKFRLNPNLFNGLIVEEDYILIKEEIPLPKLLRIFNELDKLGELNKERIEYETSLLVEPLVHLNKILPLMNVNIKGVNNVFQQIKLSRQELKNNGVNNYLLYLSDLEKKQKVERSKIIYEENNEIEEPGNFDRLEKEGFLKRGLFKSSYIVGPQLTRLWKELKNEYIETVLNGFDEITIPKYTTEQMFARSNHIRLPQHAYILAKIKPHLVDIKQFYGYVYKKWLLNENELDIAGVSTYGVCEVFWTFYENQRINLPVKFYDQSGMALRNEGHATKTFERLDGFNRVETIFIYEREEEISYHIEVYIERMKLFLNKLKFKYRILEVDSWTPTQKEENESVKTYDFEVYLAYKDQWLELGNISNNRDIFTKQFNVKSKTNNNTFSGCSGLGLERLLYAYIEQKGYKHNINKN